MTVKHSALEVFWAGALLQHGDIVRHSDSDVTSELACANGMQKEYARSSLTMRKLLEYANLANTGL